MNFYDATDAPIPCTLRGADGSKVTVLFPVLTTQQVRDVAARLQGERVAKMQAQCERFKVDPKTAAYMCWEEESAPFNPIFVHEHFMTVGGCDECLLLSLSSTSMSPEEAKSLIHKLRLDDRRALAVRVAHLYKPKELPEDTDKKDDKKTKKPEEPLGLGEQPGNADTGGGDKTS